MDKEELKKKALEFGKKAGKKALEVGKVVGKYSLEAGKEIAKEAAIVSKSLTDDADKLSKTMAEKNVNNKRWDAREGSWHSTKIFPQAFEDAETQLRYPIGTHRINVHADPSICRITVDANWNEDIAGFPNSLHQVNLILDFTASPTGTDVNYAWTVHDFPKGLHTGALIRTINSWMEMVLEGPSGP